MAMLDPNIANGTCYYAYNKAAGSELVPCGNGGIANVPCCFAGDYCDADNTCYDDSTGNSYLAGCTDAQYTDASCPWKSTDFAAQEWVGLVRCPDAVNASADEWAWAGCAVPAAANTALERLGACDCTGKATLFVGEQALTRHASLPLAVGGTISWAAGFAVTAASSSSSGMVSVATGTAAAATTAASSSGSTASSLLATAAPAASSSGGSGSSSSSSLSSGAKIGIAVGSIGAVLAISTLAFVAFLLRRRRAGAAAAGGAGGSGSSSGGKEGYEPAPAEEFNSSSSFSVNSPYGGGSSMSDVKGFSTHTYTDFKSELPADESVTPRRTTHRASTTAASSPELGGVTPATASSSELILSGRASFVSELSTDDAASRSGLFISSPPSKHMSAIAELPG